jgi:hypothetical protein
MPSGEAAVSQTVLTMSNLQFLLFLACVGLWLFCWLGKVYWEVGMLANNRRENTECQTTFAFTAQRFQIRKLLKYFYVSHHILL